MRIGLIMGIFSNTFSLNLFKQISREVISRNAHLIVFESISLNNSTPDNISNNTIFKLLESKRLDGLIILTSTVFFDNNMGLIEAIAHKARIPVVSIGMEMEGISSFTFENYSGFEKIMSHLIAHNYRKFALIGGPSDHPASGPRLDAFMRVITANGLSVPDHLILEGTFDYVSGYTQAEKLVPYIKSGDVEAVVCANDDMACAAMYCFSEHHLRVPEDVAVTGFDDSPVSSLMTPSLTTVNQNLDKMAAKAVAELFDLILGRKGTRTVAIDTDLVIRQSCGCKSMDVKRQPVINQYMNSNRVQGKLQMLKYQEFENTLDYFLNLNRINHCYIVRYVNPIPFDCEEKTQNQKVSLFYGYSNGNRVTTKKPYSFENILPDHLMDSIKDTLLVKPIFFNKNQFGFALISASEISAPFIYDLGIELNHYFEILNLENEWNKINKQLAEAHESLRISNKRLNELTVKENLDKFSNLRHLSANLMQYRRKNTGDYILIIAEIDNFTEINTRYGFKEGEFVMSCVSGILSRSIRDDDFLSHQSCDRYVILVKNVQNDPVQAIGKRFLKGLQEANRSCSKPYLISFSWGSAMANMECDFDDVYRQAEQKLMEAKEKNQISCKLDK